MRQPEPRGNHGHDAGGALALGTQVLCWDVTAMPEIITEQVGRAVPMGDFDGLEQAVRELCAQPKDPQACRVRALEYAAPGGSGHICACMTVCTETAPAICRRWRKPAGCGRKKTDGCERCDTKGDGCG